MALRPVILPQYPNPRVALGSSIVAVANGVVKGVAAVGGRVLVPIDGSAISLFGADVPMTMAVEELKQDRVRFSGPVCLDKDEYLLNLSTQLSWEISRRLTVNGTIFRAGDGIPKLVNYILFAPKEAGEIRLIVSALCEWPCVFNSEFNRRLWLDEARKFVTAAEVRRLEQHSAVANIGIDCSGIDAARHDKREPFTLGHCGRTRGTKGFVPSLEIADRIKVRMPELRYLVTTYGTSSVKLLTDLASTRPWLEPQYDMDRSHYHEHLWRVGVFSCLSAVESVGLAWLEKLYAGWVGVFWDRPWVRAILPDYPYVTNKMTEFEAMVTAALKSPETMLPAIANVRADIGARWDAATSPERVWAAADKALSGS